MAAAPASPLPLTANTIIEWLHSDTAAFMALKDQDKSALLARIHEAFNTAAARTDADLFRLIMSFVAMPRCPPDVALAASGFKMTQKRLRKCKHNFIDNAGLHVCNANCKVFLDVIPVYKVKVLPKPYPPFKKIVSEMPGIHNK
ncbi:hypothetical protein HYPSUDRAFT_1083487 [Hypholoma sublateritium FD-334 SS-4]|uniref:Uncharacterized protein n=1 Tax=Hypholoma sublateritium (strain FD-334 SS-4) TaxID=945553 RepID=A0A0D2LM71_HYPSF|nr:hypothetical protein HYPSUDRAFT_1083487 [Hypholoma sublateritium FD-334 SS-4]